MRFSFNLMGMELLSFEFAWPSKGIYQVPDSIPSEWETFDLEENLEEIESDEEDD